MCVDPVLEGAISDLSFIPVSINYEKIVEATSYVKELEGEKKKKEDVTALLSSTRVLRSRYGRVYVDFGTPISLRRFSTTRGFDIASMSPQKRSGPITQPTRPHTSEKDERTSQRAQLISQLGHRIVYGINQATRVTPTSLVALVLLSRPNTKTPESLLYQSADIAVRGLEEVGARLSSTLSAPLRQNALREAIGRLAVDGIVQMHPDTGGETLLLVDANGRRALDYYKNCILHFLIPTAVVVTAVRAYGPKQVKKDDVSSMAQRISHFLKFEFSFRADQSFRENFQQAADGLIRRGFIFRNVQENEEYWSLAPQGLKQGESLFNLLAVFLEAYRFVTEYAGECLKQPTDRNTFVKQTLDRATHEASKGTLLRPEGLSKLSIENAVKLLLADGIIERDEEKLCVAHEEQRIALRTQLDQLLNGG